MSAPFIIGATIALVVIVARQVIHHIAPALITKIEREGGFEGIEP